MPVMLKGTMTVQLGCEECMPKHLYVVSWDENELGVNDSNKRQVGAEKHCLNKRGITLLVSLITNSCSYLAHVEGIFPL